MNVDMSFLSLITEASLLVQIVMIILLFISFYSWMLIFRKRSEMNALKKIANNFEDQFWSGEELTTLSAELSKHPERHAGMAGIFQTGFKEFMRLRASSSQHAQISALEGAQRAMRVSLARDVDELETSLSFLATAGSISPYIGLFGTVWGIMNSFRALGEVQQATLAMVAPGIAEALIATAMGLFAAIPAVVAYNRFSNDAERMISRYDTFLEEFSSILQRQ